jgi:hypothetical protein
VLGATPVAAPAATVDEAGVRLDATLTEAAHQLQSTIVAARGTRTVGERTALLAAWVAVPIVAALNATSRRRAIPVPAAAPTMAARLAGDVSELVGDDAAGLRLRAAQVYADARTLAGVMGSAGAARAPDLAVTPAICQRHSDAVIADLGGIATTELLVGATRVGLPWIALSSNEVMSWIDRQRLVRPACAHTGQPLDDRNLALVRAFAGRLSDSEDDAVAFDRALQAGYEPHTALALAEHTAVSGAVLVQLEAR